MYFKYNGITSTAIVHANNFYPVLKSLHGKTIIY